MKKVLFNDKLTVKTLKNGKIEEFTSDFHKKYIDAARKIRESTEWKHRGEGARFRDDIAPSEEADYSYFNSLAFKNENHVLYSITVNDLSGIVEKDLTADKDSEIHVIHSRDLVFCGTDLNSDKTKFVTCLKENYVNGHLTEYDLKTDDYVSLTDGDCLDSDAYYSRRDANKIFFSSKGAGRNANGEFVRYSPAKICVYDIRNGDIEEMNFDTAYSYVKPKDDAEGNLYYIRRPSEEKNVNPLRTLLDIVLIPWRIIQAIYYFLESFTLLFTGRKFIKDGSNPAKTSNKSERELLVEDNLVNAEKEYKNNLRHKDANAGIAPWSWELVKHTPFNEEKVIRHGVVDYCLLDDGNVILNNGKHVLLVDTNGKESKLADAALCTKVSAI